MLEHFAHHLFHVVQIGFGLQGVVHAVITLLVEFFVGNLRVVAEVGPPGGFYQSVRHQRASRDNRIHDAAIDQLRDHQALLGHSHRPRQGHHHKTVLVAGHGFQHVGSFAQLAAGERRLRHRTHQIVDGMHLVKVEWLQRNQPVFNRIV